MGLDLPTDISSLPIYWTFLKYSNNRAVIYGFNGTSFVKINTPNYSFKYIDTYFYINFEPITNGIIGDVPISINSSDSPEIQLLLDNVGNLVRISYNHPLYEPSNYLIVSPSYNDAISISLDNIKKNCVILQHQYLENVINIIDQIGLVNTAAVKSILEYDIYITNETGGDRMITIQFADELKLLGLEERYIINMFTHYHTTVWIPNKSTMHLQVCRFSESHTGANQAPKTLLKYISGEIVDTVIYTTSGAVTQIIPTNYTKVVFFGAGEIGNLNTIIKELSNFAGVKIEFYRNAAVLTNPITFTVQLKTINTVGTVYNTVYVDVTFNVGESKKTLEVVTTHPTSKYPTFVSVY